MLPVDYGDDNEKHHEQEHKEANPCLFGGNHEQFFLVQKLT